MRHASAPSNCKAWYKELRDHGYRETTVGPFVVYAPPT